jgi:hypothetical protein
MGKAIEYDGDGPTNPDRTSRYGKKCQSSTTWLLAALDDDGLDLYSNDDYWHFRSLLLNYFLLPWAVGI